LSVRVVFVCYLTGILAGLVYLFAVALRHG
jgi:hypothetical protein